MLIYHVVLGCSETSLKNPRGKSLDTELLPVVQCEGRRANLCGVCRRMIQVSGWKEVKTSKGKVGKSKNNRSLGSWNVWVKEM